MALCGIAIISVTTLLANYVIHDTSRPPPPQTDCTSTWYLFRPSCLSATLSTGGAPDEIKDESPRDIGPPMRTRPIPRATALRRTRRQAAVPPVRRHDPQPREDVTFIQLPVKSTCNRTWVETFSWPETWIQNTKIHISFNVYNNISDCTFLFTDEYPRWVLSSRDLTKPICHAYTVSGGLKSVTISAEKMPVGTTMSEIVLTTFPLGLCEIEGGIHILNCACPHMTPPPHGSLIPVDAIKPAFTNPVQTMIYLHYRWNLTDFITGKCRWTDEQWEEFLKRPLEALQVKRHRRSLSDLFGYLGFGMSAMNTLAIGQETGKRRAQVSKTADLLEKTHEQMIRMAASSFLLEDAQKVKTLTVVVDAFGKTTDVLAEMTSRNQMLALCLHRASLDIEDTRMFLRDLTHHHLPPLLREEIDKRLPIGIKVIPQRTTHLVENPVLKVTNYELQLKVSMIIYTGTPLGDVHEHHYIGHAVGLTTMPEQVPTNGTHVIKTVCISDDQSLICQTPIKWITIDEWADQTPQSMTNKTWDVVTLTGDICVNTPILQYADLTCTLDRPACFSPKVMWLAPHGALVPPIKIDYNTTTRITRPQSPVDEALMAELSGIAQELAEKVSWQEEKHAMILHEHHVLTNNIIEHTEVLQKQAHKLVVQIKQEKWWDLFRVDASPMGVVRLCVAVLICSVPFLWMCNVCLLCLECKMM